MREKLSPLREFFQLGKLRSAPRAREVVAALSQKYQLALAANQPSEARKLLEAHGLLRYFAFDLVSEDLKLGKPDLLFFRIVLDRIGVRPEEAVMVGD